MLPSKHGSELFKNKNLFHIYKKYTDRHQISGGMQFNLNEVSILVNVTNSYKNKSNKKLHIVK